MQINVYGFVCVPVCVRNSWQGFCFCLTNVCGWRGCWQNLVGTKRSSGIGPQKGSEGWSSTEKRELELFSQMRRLQKDLQYVIELTIQYVKGAYKKDGEWFFTRPCSDRTRGGGFNQKEGRFTLEVRKGSGTQEQAARRSCGCPNPVSIQSQVGQRSEQHHLAKGVSAHGRGVGLGL